jgi:hypothetical protein
MARPAPRTSARRSTGNSRLPGMNLYRQKRDLSLVELGECELDKALKEFEATYHAGLQKYESGEDALEVTGLGLSRSDRDFLEMFCSGEERVTFHSDRLCYDSSLARLFAVKGHFEITVDKVTATQVIRDYYKLARSGFEAAYRAFLTR